MSSSFTSKNLLTVVCTVLIAAGLIAASWPFIVSLSPNAKSFANLPRVTLPPLAEGDYAHLQGVTRRGGILVFKDLAGDVHLFGTLVFDGKLYTHDYRHHMPLHQCDDFGPDFDVKEIYCKNDPNDFARFRLDGTSFVEGQDPLPRIEGYLDGDQFVLFGRKEPRDDA